MREVVDIGRTTKTEKGYKNERFYIPVADHFTCYFNAFLKLNGAEEQCPDFSARETSGDCPFYFVGGKCNKCKCFEIEKDGIINAWTAALDPYPWGYYEVASDNNESNEYGTKSQGEIESVKAKRLEDEINQAENFALSYVEAARGACLAVITGEYKSSAERDLFLRAIISDLNHITKSIQTIKIARQFKGEYA